jgi:hypothetical protein
MGFRIFLNPAQIRWKVEVKIFIQIPRGCCLWIETMAEHGQIHWCEPLYDAKAAELILAWPRARPGSWRGGGCFAGDIRGADADGISTRKTGARSGGGWRAKGNRCAGLFEKRRTKRRQPF